MYQNERENFSVAPCVVPLRGARARMLERIAPHRTAQRSIVSDYRLREAQESGFLLLHKPVPNHRMRASIAHLIDAGDKAVA